MKKNVDTIIDGHKIHLHPIKSAGWKELNDCYPIHVEIGPTDRCNHRCIFCALDFVKRGTDIDRDIMLKALKDMASPSVPHKITFEYGNRTSIFYDKVNSVMFSGGEPTLHKDLGLFVQKAKKYGLDVALTTNGNAFDKKLQEQCLPYLSWIKFSIDAGTAKTYGQIHRVQEKQFETLMKNIFDSAELKRKNNLDVAIGTQFLMIPQNARKSEVRGLIERLKKIGPDYLSVKPYSDHPRSKKNLIVDSKSYNDLEETLNDLRSEVDFKIEFRRATIDRIQEEKRYSECYALPFITLIDSKGNVLPCNLFEDMPEFSYGNLYDSSFSEIWASEKRKNVLQRLKQNGLEGCRKGCRCDAGNRYLDRLKNPQAHDNFT